MSQLPWSTTLAEALAEKRASGRYRQTRTRAGEQGVNIVLDGKRLLSFCSNDYLGLAAHPEIKRAFTDAVDSNGVGAGAAHLLAGHSKLHDELAEALVDFTGQQRVMLFSSGYQANLGVIDGLMTRDDVVIQDKLNHASLLDGSRLSDAKMYRYQHADMSALQRRLAGLPDSGNRLIVTDGVFSMDGDIAPLADIMALSVVYQSAVMVDDAHGFGVLGKTGRGTVEHLGLQQLPIEVGTFGKAFGAAGAFVAADEDVIETLIQQSRPFVYTTAQPAALAAATLASLKLIQKESWRREQLQALIAQFRTGAAALGLTVMPSETAIQPILLGSVTRVMQYHQALEEQGVLVGAIRPPTVPEGAGRLRVTLSASHTEQHVQQLLTALEKVICTLP